MKALFIGGTGTISMAISKLLLEKGWELYLINRGNRNNDERLKGAHFITVDINDEAAAAENLQECSLMLPVILSALYLHSSSATIACLRARFDSLCISARPLLIRSLVEFM